MTARFKLPTIPAGMALTGPSGIVSALFQRWWNVDLRQALEGQINGLKDVQDALAAQLQLIEAAQTTANGAVTAAATAQTAADGAVDTVSGVLDGSVAVQTLNVGGTRYTTQNGALGVQQ